MYSNRRRTVDDHYRNFDARQDVDTRRSGSWRRFHRRNEGHDCNDPEEYRRYSPPRTRYEERYNTGASRNTFYRTTSNNAYEDPHKYEVSWRRTTESQHDSFQDPHPSHAPRPPRKEVSPKSTRLTGPFMALATRFSPPPPSHIPSSPSEEYLKSAAEPSTSTSTPSRKLIILDLNGTLLLRLRSVGAVYPRPYMPSFRDFLLHPETRKWLDIMVWSSAQRHNVERMVRRCFFDRSSNPAIRDAERRRNEEEKQDSEIQDEWEGKFIAVWARDTLGLSRSEYSRKVQTTKDLEKPWSELPGEHSARSTLLLDDSPKKARLQPYNHVCIGEYTPVLREQSQRVKRGIVKVELESHLNKPDYRAERNESHVADGDGNELHTSPETEEVRKKKKQIKKEQQRLARISAALLENSSLPVVGEASPQESANEEFDGTLLAVIGVLHTLKHQSNVAGWIRAGGLWAGKTPPQLDASVATTTESSECMPSPTDVEMDGDEQRPEEATATEVAMVAGNDVQTSGAISNSNPHDEDHSETINEGPDAKMWFEDKETTHHWVVRGREALEELGIEKRDGISVE
ncbi:uncharacterized protein FOMMEDRAFT_170016 [Fomitiporia mediterranea MF3/22]|uniref:uncharacterized protein n=1 Tax=Fomitiporia mediterranea (strain MF3/22) TaxID=694068 RepID=UPI0004408809|nr:uncharacterized protein FOMMEDRAFT_170016 [Fomitiporia mediterranea MF3/22]EJD00649.1 hypothetical protein FOMMEDRAFT_170016 [Fomitiporia mediterranea MF3/22]